MKGIKWLLILLPSLFVLLLQFLGGRVVLDDDVSSALSTTHHHNAVGDRKTTAIPQLPEILQEQRPNDDVELATKSHAHPRRPRLLLFVGPHKTASTTIQHFLFQLNNHFNNKKKNQATKQENEDGFYLVKGHPLVPKTLLVPPTWKRLWKQSNNDQEPKVYEDDEQELLQWIQDKGQSTRQYLSSWNNATKNNSGDIGQPAPLLVWAQENFDVLAGLDDNDDDIRQALARMWKWFGTDDLEVEVVVMYRTPRTEHLISMWKESMTFLDETKYPWRTKVQSTTPRKARLTLPTLAEWMCTGVWPGVAEYNVTLQLATWINPWGLAHALHKHVPAAKVSMVNMAGVRNQDIPSMVACEFLQLHSSCVEFNETYNDMITRTKTVKTIRKLNISNFTYHKVVNAKTKSPGLTGFTDDDLAEAERILRQMDCYYFCELGKTIFTEEGRPLDRSSPAFRILYHEKPSLFGGDDIRQSWEHCCRQTESVKETGVSHLGGTATAKQLRNLACIAHSQQRKREDAPQVARNVRYR